MSSPPLPLVAVVGRPNVGKSTLFNRLVGGRPALVEDEPGVTRDRRYGELEWNGRRARVVDTGGLDPSAPAGAIQAGIHRQAHRALSEAAVILFVLDAKEGLSPVDREVARLLRAAGPPVLVCANKVDVYEHEVRAAEFYELGLGDVYAISATHGRGVHDLLEAVIARLPEAAAAAVAPAEGADEGADEALAAAPADDAVRVAFLGRPNVGKSSLVNRILGEERVLVHDQPGTTTDPVDTPFDFLGKPYVLVDTAGIRRRARIEAPTEKIAVSMALHQIQRADVVVLVIDAALGPAEQDARIAGLIEETGRAVVVALNKVDLLPRGRRGDEAERALKEKVSETLPFLPFASRRLISATTGQGVSDLLGDVRRAWEEHGRRVTTAELNRFFTEICEQHPPPTFRGRPVRIHYLTQPVTHPPTFVLWANRPDLLNPAYRRYLSNQLRERFGFQGTPVRIIARRRGK